MTTSNTKLTKDQKEDRKQLLACLKHEDGEIFSYPEHNATIVVVPEFKGSGMVRVSVSYSSPNEKKFRRKVGEYYALSKMFDCEEYIKIPLKNNSYYEIAGHISYLIEGII